MDKFFDVFKFEQLEISKELLNNFHFQEKIEVNLSE